MLIFACIRVDVDIYMFKILHKKAYNKQLTGHILVSGDSQILYIN